jgi:hypothetical protein
MTPRLLLPLTLAALAALAATAAFLEHSHRKSLQHQVAEQSAVIDSLLSRNRPLLDVQLHVTDRSRNVIYGRYNRGTISMPQERRYILEVDSSTLVVKSWK